MTNIQMQAAIQPTTGSDDTSRKARLKKAAGEFEAQMMSELLKPMQSDPLCSDGDDSAGASATIQGMAAQAMSQAMAAQGGIGIAAKVMKSIRDEPAKIQAVPRSASISGGYSQTGKLVTGQ